MFEVNSDTPVKEERDEIIGTKNPRRTRIEYNGDEKWTERKWDGQGVTER